MAYIKHEPSFEDQQTGRKLHCPVCHKNDVCIEGPLTFDSSTNTVIKQALSCRLCLSKWDAVWYINEVENVTKPTENSIAFILTPDSDLSLLQKGLSKLGKVK